MGRLDGKRIAVLSTDGFEQSELISPKTALEAEGAQVDVVSPHEGEIRGWNHKDWGENVRVSTTIEAADATKLGRIPASLVRKVASRLGRELGLGT